MWNRAPEPTTVDVCPYPTTQEGSAAFFERTSTMLAEAFTHAKAVGVQSCVGTETPLSKPSPPGPKCTVKGADKCYKDTESRILPHVVTISSNLNSHEWCAGQCALANFTIAAVEYGAACLCGNSFPQQPTLPASACAAMPCAGNSAEHCGGNYILSAYEFECDESKPHPVAPTTQDYYEGMFTRLLKKVPALDWYWIWTPEVRAQQHSDHHQCSLMFACACCRSDSRVCLLSLSLSLCVCVCVCVCPSYPPVSDRAGSGAR